MSADGLEARESQSGQGVQQSALTHISELKTPAQQIDVRSTPLQLHLSYLL